MSRYFTNILLKLWVKELFSNSPGYWVGYGRFPHSVQNENVNLSIYSIPDDVGFMEDKLFYFTHAYFPTTLFDEYSIEGRYAFARVEDTYVALIGLNELYLGQEIANPGVTSTYDLIQDGQITYWITEVSGSSRELSFNLFKEQIKNNTLNFDETDLTLTYLLVMILISNRFHMR